MVTTVKVVHHRRDPDGIKPHAFDVIKLLQEALECAAAVVAVGAAALGTRVARAGRERKAVRQDLVDRAALPLRGGERAAAARHGQQQQQAPQQHRSSALHRLAAMRVLGGGAALALGFSLKLGRQLVLSAAIYSQAATS